MKKIAFMVAHMVLLITSATLCGVSAREHSWGYALFWGTLAGLNFARLCQLAEE